MHHLIMKFKIDSRLNKIRLITSRTLIFSMIAFGPGAAIAQQIQVLNKQVAGGDCDALGTSITMSPDNASFSILYSGMSAEASPEQAVAQKKCYVDIDFAIPPNTQLEFVKIQYRGFMGLFDAQTFGMIKSHHYFLNGTTEFPGGQRQPGGLLAGGIKYTGYGPVNNDVFWEAAFRSGDSNIKSISRCVGSAKLRIDTEILVNRFDEGAGGIVALDTADGQLETVYQVALRPCDKGNQRFEKVCRQGSCYYFDPRTGRSIRQP